MIPLFIEIPFLSKKEVKEVYEDGYEISSLENTSAENGKFVLGIGSSSGGRTEYYFIKKAEYGYSIESLRSSIAAGEVHVQETDEETPKIKYVYEEKYFTGNYEKWFGESRQKSLKATLIVVPKDTVMTEYSINKK